MTGYNRILAGFLKRNTESLELFEVTVRDETQQSIVPLYRIAFYILWQLTECILEWKNERKIAWMTEWTNER